MASITTVDKVSLSEELKAAVTTASLGGQGKTNDVMLMESHLPTLVPSQSLLKVRSVKFEQLKMGDIVCIRVGSSFRVRRYVKRKMTPSRTFLLVAADGLDKKEPIPPSALIGRVDSVEHGGRVFDPHKKENFFKSFWGKLTEYGTHKPFGILSAR